jgi:LPXTG-motif cell wall-anchored protein
LDLINDYELIESEKMKKSASSSFMASFLALTVTVSAPAFGAPTSILNGDFESGDNGATSIQGWTSIEQRIDLGSDTIAGCLSEDTSNYSNLRDYFYESIASLYGGEDHSYRTISSDTVGTSGVIGFTRYRNFLTNEDDEIQVLAGGRPVGYERALVDIDENDNHVFTIRVFLELDATTSPRTRVFEESWTSAQRADVQALVRDAVAANDSLNITWDESVEPRVFNVGLRSNASASDSFVEGWQSFDSSFAWDSQFLELYSDMDAQGGPERLGYIVHGPAVFSDEFTAKTIDDLSFKFAASDQSDDYKVFGYLLNTETCAQTEVLDSTGEFRAWETVVAPVPADGTYRFVFVSGTYDKTWGSVAGAVMFLDDVVLSPNQQRVAEAQQAANTAPKLAATGANVEWLMVAGLLAVIAGAGFLVASRRKRTA